MTPEYLQGGESDRIYESVYSQHRGIGVAAGEFLSQKLFVDSVWLLISVPYP